MVSLHIKATTFLGRKKELDDTLVETEDNGNDDSENKDKSESPVLPERLDRENSQLGYLVTALKEKLSNERYIVLLGDFNMPPDNKGELAGMCAGEGGVVMYFLSCLYQFGKI